MVRLGLALLVMPGVVFHELGHFVFCKLVGARVHKVVFFQFGHPAGYVIHSAPTRFVEHLAIVVGPFVVNSAVAFVLFRASSSGWAYLSHDGSANAGVLVAALLALWWGISISVQAFPSKGDARSLWKVATAHVRKGDLLAVVGYPVVVVIYAADILRSVRVDMAYAIVLLVVAAFA